VRGAVRALAEMRPRTSSLRDARPVARWVTALVAIVFIDIMRLNVRFVSRTASINDSSELTSLNSLHSEPVSSGGVVPSVKSTSDVAAEQRRGTRASTRQYGDGLVPAERLSVRRRRRTRSSTSINSRRSRFPFLISRSRDSLPREKKGENETVADSRSPGLSARQRFAWF